MMDTNIFQVVPNKLLPEAGEILIASPLLADYHFTRAVILLVTHDDSGSMGIVVNRDYRKRVYLHDLFPELKDFPHIPVFSGGPVDRNVLFFIHNLDFIPDKFPLGNGLFLNGDFESVKKYISEGNVLEGRIRFFCGYAGWGAGQLEREIKEASWMVGKADYDQLMVGDFTDLWHDALSDIGDKERIWANYPLYPSYN